MKNSIFLVDILQILVIYTILHNKSEKKNNNDNKTSQIYYLHKIHMPTTVIR